ncbi:hypothetical protein [Sulfitobacter sp. S190]|uniref:hypothetical protein n=1 Tax=Sulfitobacter sp. S190 TaxID=2867022 RepID=UPI0021A4F159|nr:hypothetical protein [Sulfitobacter sp. S190]UWR21839.1 hypothetical protein K3756_14265 [Sulfitobacter sp. S190]
MTNLALEIRGSFPIKPLRSVRIDPDQLRAAVCLVSKKQAHVVSGVCGQPAPVVKAAGCLFHRPGRIGVGL